MSSETLRLWVRQAERDGGLRPGLTTQVSLSLRSGLALDALEMALWARGKSADGFVPHADRGSQNLSIRCSERLAEAGAVASVGSRGDSYDNALAETILGLYKTEVIRRRGPWKNIDDVEFATLEWIDWFNHRRRLEPIGDIPPAEYEMLYWTSPAERIQSDSKN
jgi:putative transposase